VCEQLGIKDGESEHEGTNMLKRLKIDNPTQQEKDYMSKKAVEEHHRRLFVLGGDKKNDVKCKKDPFSKTVAEACHVLS